MLLSVKVKPGSKQPGLSFDGDCVILRVRERAIEGAANAACVRALAAALEIAPSRVLLVRGAHGREKLFEILGVEEAEARKRLHLRV
jgi:uncharacterized protein YggU (UPF0235/DUF167 family)